MAASNGSTSRRRGSRIGPCVLTSKATVLEDLRAAVSQAVEGGDEAVALVAEPLI
jgi:hypothetical protein